MNLHIFDCSNYIYAGAFSNATIARGVRETNGEYQANEAPIGGVRFLLTRIASLLTDDNVLMPVFDRPPIIKREMYKEAFGGWESYKGNRPDKRFDITNQQKYAEEILRGLDFPVQAVDGYEADDVIYSLVQYYRDDFDQIFIHTRDSDLFFLVDEKVSIAKVGGKGKEIDMYNYPVMVRKNENVLYNTVHLRKLCAGDASDNIPGVGWDFATLMDKVVPNEDYAKLGDLDISRKYILKTITENPTLPGGHNILRTFNILCPLLIDYEELNDVEQDVDMSKLSYYLNDWNPSLDKWNLEDMLSEYIDSYYV
jgi:hypothetical protein